MRDHRILGLLQSGDHIFGVDNATLAEVALVQKLEPFLSDRPEVLGAITLRGVTIPVLDPLALSGYAPRATCPKIAAVLQSDDSLFALAIDQVLDLHRFDPARLQTAKDVQQQPILEGYLPTEAGLVNVVDSALVFEAARLPRANRGAPTRREKVDRSLTPHLTFESGGVIYAVDVKDIFNTVPSRQIDGAIGTLLGVITYLDRRIPVIDTNTALNISSQERTGLPEFVVLRLRDDKLLGLAVDRIRKIEYLAEKRFRPLPPHLQASAPLIKASFLQPGSDVTVMVLDAAKADEMPELQSIADLSKKEQTPALREDQGEPPGAPKQIVRTRMRNIVFVAGCELATPIHCVSGVLTPPETLTPWMAPIPGLMGLFGHNDRLLPLLDLSAYLGKSGDEAAEYRRILLVGEEDEAIGFLVDHIKGISISNWHTEQKEGILQSLAQIQEWPKNRLVARIALDHLAQGLIQTMK